MSWPTKSAGRCSTSPRKAHPAVGGGCGRTCSAASRASFCRTSAGLRLAPCRRPRSHRASSGSVTSATSPPAVTGSTPRIEDACTACPRSPDRPEPIGDRSATPCVVRRATPGTLACPVFVCPAHGHGLVARDQLLPLMQSEPLLIGHSCGPLGGWAGKVRRDPEGVLIQDLPAANPDDDVVAEVGPSLRSTSTMGPRSATSGANRFQSPGRGSVPPDIDCRRRPWPRAALSARRTRYRQ